MKARFLVVLPLLNSLKPEIIHIKREKNSIADFLANEAYNHLNLMLPDESDFENEDTESGSTLPVVSAVV